MPHHLTSIVAIDQKDAIGCKNHLPWSIKSDLAFFRRTTLGHSIIMGRKTYVSVGARPLPGRNNIVLSHNSVLFEPTENCQLVASVEEAMATVLRGPQTQAFVIGGAATYCEFAPFVDKYIVTLVEHEAIDADAFLARPILDSLKAWPARELGCFPALPGKDEFAFRIVEFTAPDADARRQARRQIAADYLGRALNSRPKRKHSQANSQALAQKAFAF